MITSEQLKVYIKYKANIDRLHLVGTEHERSTLDYESYWLIENLMQDLVLIRRGLVSLDYAKKALDTLNSVCDDESTIKLFHEVAESEV